MEPESEYTRVIWYQEGHHIRVLSKWRKSCFTLTDTSLLIHNFIQITHLIKNKAVTQVEPTLQGITVDVGSYVRWKSEV